MTDSVPFEGRIELSRNGDVAVTTNGVSEFYPRELPFEHEGYGQDGEWVEANFANGGGGSMTWPIPNEYTGNAGSLSGVLFCNTDQHFSVDSVGTSHEEKFGWFAEVSINRVFSYGRTTTP